MPDRAADVTRIFTGGRQRGLSDDQIRALVARYDERTLSSVPSGVMPTRPPDLDTNGQPTGNGGYLSTDPNAGTLVAQSRRPLSIVKSEPLPFSERHALAIRRTTLAGQLLALWAVPAGFLYALGWSVGWVWRGFRS